MLALERVSYTYPSGVQAVREVSFAAAAGERVALVGPSGCGKSTLLRLIAGLLPVAGGRIRGADGASLMFQDPALLGWRTVAANIGLPLELAGEPATVIKQRVDALLELTGLAEFRAALPSELSGGMAQRVALARALITRPSVLLLDEPFGALDAMTRERLTASVDDICAQANATLVLVTHNIAEAVYLADRVLALSPRPARVLREIQVTLPRPRNWDQQRNPEFGALTGAVRDALSAHEL
jgi:NitT/TauT family transport system ATP-binding protein